MEIESVEFTSGISAVGRTREMVDIAMRCYDAGVPIPEAVRTYLALPFDSYLEEICTRGSGNLAEIQLAENMYDAVTGKGKNGWSEDHPAILYSRYKKPDVVLHSFIISLDKLSSLNDEITVVLKEKPSSDDREKLGIWKWVLKWLRIGE